MYALNCFSCNDASNTFMHAYTYVVDILFNPMVRSQSAHSPGPLLANYRSEIQLVFRLRTDSGPLLHFWGISVLHRYLCI